MDGVAQAGHAHIGHGPHLLPRLDAWRPELDARPARLWPVGSRLMCRCPGRAKSALSTSQFLSPFTAMLRACRVDDQHVTL